MERFHGVKLTRETLRSAILNQELKDPDQEVLRPFV
jgi:hypothetical protein